MALRHIITLPDPKLRLVSKPIERIDDPIRKLIDDMIETMHDAPGIGLAAIQIAEPIRLLVVDVAKKEEPPQPQVFVNPQILWRSDERSTYEEGCLSIPEYYAEVERPASVRVRALDRDGTGPGSNGRGAARHRPAARDRPPRRRPVHRPHFEAQARPGDQEVPEGGQARRRRVARAVRRHRAGRMSRPRPRPDTQPATSTLGHAQRAPVSSIIIAPDGGQRWRRTRAAAAVRGLRPLRPPHIWLFFRNALFT